MILMAASWRLSFFEKQVVLLTKRLFLGAYLVVPCKGFNRLLIKYLWAKFDEKICKVLSCKLVFLRQIKQLPEWGQF
jgi:hypothetical protein